MTRQDLPRPSWGWQDDAKCRGEDLELFFGPDGERQPEREVREAKAKRICMGCPVRTDCLDYAVSAPERYGTWGGLNEDERASERRRRLRRAAVGLVADTPPVVVDSRPRNRDGSINYGYGRCTVCPYTKGLRADGTLIAHNRANSHKRCDGSWKAPAADLEAAS